MAERRNPQRSIYPDRDDWRALKQYALDTEDTASGIASRLIFAFVHADERGKERMLRGN